MAISIFLEMLFCLGLFAILLYDTVFANAVCSQTFDEAPGHIEAFSLFYHQLGHRRCEYLILAPLDSSIWLNFTTIYGFEPSAFTASTSATLESSSSSSSSTSASSASALPSTEQTAENGYNVATNETDNSNSSGHSSPSASRSPSPTAITTTTTTTANTVTTTTTLTNILSATKGTVATRDSPKVRSSWSFSLNSRGAISSASSLRCLPQVVITEVDASGTEALMDRICQRRRNSQAPQVFHSRTHSLKLTYVWLPDHRSGFSAEFSFHLKTLDKTGPCEFTCLDSGCLSSWALVCDGVFDCADRSDEHDCSHRAPPGGNHGRRSANVPGVQIIIIVVAVVLAIGALTCVIGHYRMGARSWSERRSRSTAQHSPQGHHYHMEPHASTVLYAPAGTQQERLAQHGVAALRERQLRLQSVHTDLQLDLPPSICLPDGEEVPYSSLQHLHLRDPEQESEIYRECIRPPPNRTVFEGESPPPYRSSSVGVLHKAAGGLALGLSSGSGSPSRTTPEWNGSPLVMRCHSVSWGSVGYGNSNSGSKHHHHNRHRTRYPEHNHNPVPHVRTSNTTQQQQQQQQLQHQHQHHQQQAALAPDDAGVTRVVTSSNSPNCSTTSSSSSSCSSTRCSGWAIPETCSASTAPHHRGHHEAKPASGPVDSSSMVRICGRVDLKRSFTSLSSSSSSSSSTATTTTTTTCGTVCENGQRPECGV